MLDEIINGANEAQEETSERVITISEKDFKRLCVEASQEIIELDLNKGSKSKEDEPSPMMIMMETLVHLQYSSHLREKLFGKEKK